MEASRAWQSASASRCVGFLCDWVTEKMTAFFPFSSVFAKGDHTGVLIMVILGS